MSPNFFFDIAAAHAATPACDDASNDQKLQLYALFKQAKKGDAGGPRPGVFDPVGRAKFDAWAKLAGLPPDEARDRYVRLVRAVDPAFAPPHEPPDASAAAAAASAAAAAAVVKRDASSRENAAGLDAGATEGAMEWSARALPDGERVPPAAVVSPAAAVYTEAGLAAAAASALADSPAVFDAAAAHAATPACDDASNDQKLQLYALFKQVIVGAT
jgi:acyl-CoA-binding protein